MVGHRRSRLLSLAAALCLAALVLVVPVYTALAQDYSFEVDSNVSSVYIQEDGSIDIVYDITYTSDPGAHIIDIVDIGLPNDYYDLSSATATIDGQPVSGIYKSEWLDTGVEIHLGSNDIMPGETGTVHLEINNPHMVYQDDQDEEYASVRFYPHYYEGTAHGTTYLRVNIYFPPGVQPEESRYHDLEFTEAYVEGDRIVMSWVNTEAQADQQYQFGVSFPKKYVNQVYAKPTFDFAGAIVGLISALFGSLLPLTICGGFALWVILGAVIGSLRRRKRLMDYMPPMVSVEGLGIKRGLTAVEAAVLLEAPLNRVLTMILFGLAKKGAVRVTSEKPLKLEKADPLPKGLRSYEKDFVGAINKKGGLTQKELTTLTTKLIKDVNQKMKGFHAKDTIAYYKDIVSRAWKQVEAGKTPEVVDENLEWMMMDEDFETQLPETFGSQPLPMPAWWWIHSTPSTTTTPSSTTVGKPAPSTGGPQTVPGAQLANTVVTGIEGISNTIVTNLSDFTARVTRVTHPAPVSKSSGGWSRSSSGGGSSCACACACAGCACACAGGGR
jgi:hypothetical protein